MNKSKVVLKTVLVIGVALILSAGIVYSIRVKREKETLRSELDYQSKNPSLDFAFKYPKNWQPRESQGRRERYDAVQVLGPRDKQNEFSVAFVISVKPGGNKTVTDSLSDYIKSTSRFSGFKVLETNGVTVGKQNTSSARYQYLMRLPLRKLNARDVLVKGETFFLANENKSYWVSFLGTAKQFDEYLPVFRRMMKTFRFTGGQVP